MMKSRLQVVFVLAATLTGSCGGGASPTAPTASPPVPTFTPGTYTLTLSTPGTQPVQPGGPNFATTICVSVGGESVGSTTLDITVDVQGTQITGRSTNGSLSLGVQTTQAVAFGGLSGTATNPATGVNVSVLLLPGETSIGLSGAVTSSRTMAGYANGQILFSTSKGSYGCNSANWSLSPR